MERDRSSSLEALLLEVEVLLVIGVSAIKTSFEELMLIVIGGDTNSNWGDMYFGISQALQMSIAGIPYFGVETCGFNGNADMELCTRWMQLSAWFPM